jgi:glycosyltransferase involved in cell wall biosynthesis
MVVEQSWQPVPGGSGTYIARLSESITETEPDVELVGVRAAHRRGASPQPQLVPSVSRTVVAPLPRRALYDAWNWAGAPRAEHLVAGVDVVHATTWAVPPTRRPLVVTVHDLAFLRTPEHFTPRGARYFTRSLERTRAEATRVVVPSAATRDDCVEAGIEPERLVVVPHGVRVPTVAPTEVARFRERVGLARPYVLWCGTVEPRKNVDRLVEAFDAADLPEPMDLALVGPTGWGAGPARHVERPDRAVRHLGRLSEDDLHRAYAGAAAFCYPSLWEGFGMPVLEAMAHAVPVVTSAGTSMAEFVSDAGVLVDPLDPGAIARGLEEALGSRGPDLGARGRAAAAALTWERAARATVAAYDVTAGQST